jgi:hypothetical protein
MDTGICTYDFEGAKFEPPSYVRRNGHYSGSVTLFCVQPLNFVNVLARRTKLFVEDKILTPLYGLKEV